jgi:hypothetical protein
MARTTTRTHDYYVIDRESQHPLGVYEAMTPYRAIALAAKEWSVSPDQLTAREMPAPTNPISISTQQMISPGRSTPSARNYKSSWDRCPVIECGS